MISNSLAEGGKVVGAMATWNFWGKKTIEEFQVQSKDSRSWQLKISKKVHLFEIGAD